MRTQVVIGDLRTGRNLVYLPASGISELDYGTARNTADDVKVVFNMRDPATKKLGISPASTPGASFAVVVNDGVPEAGGPIWISNFPRSTGKRTITGKGMWSYFDHRVLIPLVAQSMPIINPDTGEPYAVMNTNLVGLSYGTIAKRLVQQAIAFTGGHVPMVFQDDESADVERHYEGTDLAMVGERLLQLTELQNGPDIAFTPRFTSDGLGMEWVLRTGTVEKPDLAGETIHIWDYSVPNPSMKDLETTIDASSLASRFWLSGGSTDDRTYIERADDSSLLDAGFPLLETAGSSDAETPAVLASKSKEQVRIHKFPLWAWTFSALADGDPKAVDVSVGDYCRFIIKNDDEIPDSGPVGYLRRVATKTGDKKGRWVKITLLDTYGEPDG